MDRLREPRFDLDVVSLPLSERGRAWKLPARARARWSSPADRGHPSAQVHRRKRRSLILRVAVGITAILAVGFAALAVRSRLDA